MTTLIHADIFFFVTTIAVVILTILFSVIAWYALHILRDIKHISEKARIASDDFEEGLKTLVSTITRFVFRKIFGSSSTKSSRKKQDSEDTM